MSYEITLKSEGGRIVSTDVSGELPDGEHKVSGHDDAYATHLSVTRRDPAGRFVTAAQHSHEKER